MRHLGARSNKIILMKIGIVLHPYNEKNPAGLARIIFEIAKGMLDADKKNEYFIFVKGDKSKPDLPGNNWKFVALHEGKFWLEGLKRYPDIDVVIFNTPVLPLFHKPKKSAVIAIDYAYKIFPASGFPDALRRYFTELYQLFSLKKADIILATSEYAKNDTMKFFGIPAEKIKVFYCGFKKICGLQEKAVTLPEKYFLYVGVVKERKNLLGALRAFNLFQKERPNFYFVVSGYGRGEYYDKVKDYVKKEGLEKKVIFLNQTGDEELAYVYKRAQALVFPSLLEGFGFPVLEAMDCGIPVITSNTTSLGEIGKGAAILIGPQNDEGIKNAMQKIAGDESYREELIGLGRTHSAKFTWQKAAHDLLAIISGQ